MSITYKPYNPPSTTSKQNTTGRVLSPFEVCTYEQAREFHLLIAPLFSIELITAVDYGVGPFDYLYDQQELLEGGSINPTFRGRYFFASLDGTVNAQEISPVIQFMFSKGVGYPGYFKMVSLVQVGGTHPGKVYPPKLTWLWGTAPTVAPKPVTEVHVSSGQANILAG